MTTSRLTRTRAVHWTPDTPTTWIATVDDTYDGVIEFRDGGYSAYDRAGGPLGDHASLAMAKAAFEATEQHRTRPAAVTGLIILAAAVMIAALVFWMGSV